MLEKFDGWKVYIKNEKRLNINKLRDNLETSYFKGPLHWVYLIFRNISLILSDKS